MENTNIDLEKLKTHLVQIGAKANLIDGVDKQTEDSTTENIKLDDKTEEQINEPDEDVLKKQLADLFENNLKFETKGTLISLDYLKIIHLKKWAPFCIKY